MNGASPITKDLDIVMLKLLSELNQMQTGKKPIDFKVAISMMKEYEDMYAIPESESRFDWGYCQMPLQAS